MFNFKGSRLNITFIDLSKLDEAFKVYNKPLPCIAKKSGSSRLVYPLFTKSEWIDQVLNGNGKILIPTNWKEKSPLIIPEEDFLERFMPLQGELTDSSLMCGLIPTASDAVKVDIPACIEVNGRIIMIDEDDVLLSNKLGSKFVVDKEVFEQLFANDLESACNFDYVVKSRPSQSNDLDNELSM